MISATLLLWRGYTSARRWAWPAGISKKYCMGLSENVGENFDGLSTFSLLKWQFRGIHHFQTNSYQQPPDWLPWVLWHSSNMLGGESINLNHNQTSISPLSTDLPWNKDLVDDRIQTPTNTQLLVGGIPTPVKNMSSSVGIILPNIWKKKDHVPNHQFTDHFHIFHIIYHIFHNIFLAFSGRLPV